MLFEGQNEDDEDKEEEEEDNINIQMHRVSIWPQVFSEEQFFIRFVLLFSY